MKKLITVYAVAGLIIAMSGSAQANTVTIATFTDPSEDFSDHLFTINIVSNRITGGWDDTKAGLSLEMPYSGHTFPDAFFTMTDVDIISETDPWKGTKTGGGVIKFFEDDTANPDTATPLIQITFNSAWLTFYGYGASDSFSADEVTITGSEIIGSLEDEAFSFSFANQVLLSDDWNEGYTATSSFTSSAIPEPATVLLLGLGSLALIRRRRR